MYKKTLVITALMLASTSVDDATAQQVTNSPSKVTAPPPPIAAAPKTAVSPTVGTREIDAQRSKSLSKASPAAASKLNRVGAEVKNFIEHWKQANKSTVNPVGNVQKTLKEQ